MLCASRAHHAHGFRPVPLPDYTRSILARSLSLMATQRRTSASFFGGLCSRELGDACELFTPYAPADPESLSPSPFRFLSSQSRVPGIKMASPPLPLPPSTTLLPRRPGRPCATKETEIPGQAVMAGRLAGEVGRSY
ncbi:hypothetical protein PR202_ga29555 [Eleusine coracana subsp. coracana]|uniref:Uncharacterized protein n=1 Tax=Eleusine coracana subsp. coracana TaxID=191504 RepID=A0AAV5DJW3_ELECO|nr:hypothetical protein PR202_ga29555 [Eleusine coracana subsp. coracana]